MSRYKIAIIVTYFTELPSYFQAWLRSAENNPDIEFFLFCVGDVKTTAPNIHVEKTTLKREVLRAEEALGERITGIQGGYKFCDMRPLFGLIYQKYLVGFDFWGFSDIDLVLGNMRDFLTDDILEKYERFYEWGYFSVFKNNEKINHLLDLEGSIYSKDEIFRSVEKVNADEHFGLNRICTLNKIKWYKELDYADFWVCYSDLWLWKGRSNYDHQVFYWENGQLYRAYIDENGHVQTNQYIFMHWQKRNPKVRDGRLECDSFFITSTDIIPKETGIPDKEQIIKMCPVRTEADRKIEKRKYIIKKMIQFLNTPTKQKKIWLKQKREYRKETGKIMEH